MAYLNTACQSRREFTKGIESKLPRRPSRSNVSRALCLCSIALDPAAPHLDDPRLRKVLPCDLALNSARGVGVARFPTRPALWIALHGDGDKHRKRIS